MRTLLTMALLVLSIACSSERLSPKETVTAYYEAFDASDYKQVKNLINDSIVLISGDYTMPYSQETFYEHFKWDSVFKPTYELLEIQEQGDQVLTTVASHSLRYEFLKNNPLSFRYKFYFKKGKIAKLEDQDLQGTDWKVWQQERDSLVQWIKNNHTELDGFINDLSMQGAIDYLKAIELYEQRRDDL